MKRVILSSDEYYFNNRYFNAFKGRRNAHNNDILAEIDEILDKYDNTTEEEEVTVIALFNSASEEDQAKLIELADQLQ